MPKTDSTSAKNPSSTAEDSHRRLRVLIAEDDSLVRQTLSDLLTDFGWEVAGAVGNGRDALDASRNLRPDVVLMDLDMPEMDGLEATRRIQATYPRPVVILTGVALKNIEEEISRAGAGAFLVKPPDKTELYQAVAIACQRFEETAALQKNRFELQRAVQFRAREIQKLKDQVLKLNHALGQSAVSVIITNHEGVIEYVNARFTLVTGYSYADLLGESIQRFRGESMMAEDVRRLEERLSSGREWSGEIQTRRKNGEVFWETATISPIINSEMQVTHFVEIREDLTKWKKIEDELRRYQHETETIVRERTRRVTEANHQLREEIQRRRFTESELGEARKLQRLLCEHSPHVVARLDARGYYNYCSPSVRALLGLTPGEVTGRKTSAFVHPRDLPMIRKKHEAMILDEKQPVRYVCRWRNKNGGYLRAESRLHPLFDPGTGEFKGAVETVRALNGEKEKTPAALAERSTDDMKSVSIAILSHELRTPLNAILGFSSMINAVSLGEEDREALGMIRQSGEHMLRIVDDLLDFAKLEHGVLRLDTAAFSPRQAAEAVTAQHQAAAEEKKMALTCRLDGSIPRLITGDEGRFRQVLDRLIGNAVKFTKKGSVEVAGHARPGRQKGFLDIIFTIRDTGPGIPEDKQEMIFRPFTQADASLTREHDGSGMGLAVSRRLCRLMGGGLQVESAPGRGSVFTFTIQGAEVAPEAQKPDSSAAETVRRDESFAAQYPARVLVVEDDSVNCLLISKMLGRLGYKPAFAANGREALKQLEKNPFDLVFMDVQMPVMDGIEATRRLRQGKAGEINRQTPVIALTAHAYEKDRKNCLGAGMTGYISKPTNIQKLAGQIAQVRSEALRASGG